MSSYRSILDSSARNEEYRTQIQLDQHEDTIRFKDNVGYTGYLSILSLILIKIRIRQIYGYKDSVFAKYKDTRIQRSATNKNTNSPCIRMRILFTYYSFRR